MFETARDVASTYCGWVRRNTAEGSDQLKRRFPLLVVLHLRSAPFKHDHETRFRLSDCDMAFHFEVVRPSANSALALQVFSIPVVPADSQPAGDGSGLASRHIYRRCRSDKSPALSQLSHYPGRTGGNAFERTTPHRCGRVDMARSTEHHQRR